MKNNPTINENKLMTELPILLITLAPIVYLLLIWNLLPDTVPMHWNFKGEVDSYGSKYSLWVVILAINLPMYLLMLFLPKIAAKAESFNQMGKKYNRLRFILQLFMSAIVCVIIFSSSGLSDIGIEIMLGFCFALFMILFGNYMGSIRQNHFVGIRTPWTLENEEVWKKTHQFCGRMWIVSGFIGLILVFFLSGNWALVTIVGLMIIPMIIALIYSYKLFKKLEKGKD